MGVGGGAKVLEPEDPPGRKSARYPNEADTNTATRIAKITQRLRGGLEVAGGIAIAANGRTGSGRVFTLDCCDWD
jgi:hypothetical protein